MGLLTLDMLAASGLGSFTAFGATLALGAFQPVGEAFQYGIVVLVGVVMSVMGLLAAMDARIKAITLADRRVLEERLTNVANDVVELRKQVNVILDRMMAR